MRRVAAACAVLVLVPAVSFGAIAPMRPAPIVPRPNASLTERSTIKLLNLKDRLGARMKVINAKIQAKWPKWLPRDKAAWVGKFAKGAGYGLAATGALTMNPILATSGMALAYAGRAAHKLALPGEKDEGTPGFLGRRFAFGGKLAMFGMRLFGGLSRRAGVAGVVGGGLLLNPWVAGGGLLIQAAGGIVRALNHRLELKRAGLLGGAVAALEEPLLGGGLGGLGQPRVGGPPFFGGILGGVFDQPTPPEEPVAPAEPSAPRVKQPPSQPVSRRETPAPIEKRLAALR